MADDDGTPSPWIELYNPTGVDISLAGYSVTDDFANPNKSVLPAGVGIAAGGYLVLWADGNLTAGPTAPGDPSVAERGLAGACAAGRNLHRPHHVRRAGDRHVGRARARRIDTWVTAEWTVSPMAANPTGAGQPRVAQADTDPPEAIAAAGDVSDRVLGYDLTPTFDLEMSAENIAALRASPSNWVQASLVFQGRTYGPIGVNLKGTSSFMTIDQKPGFRVNINKYAKAAFGLSNTGLFWLTFSYICYTIWTRCFSALCILHALFFWSTEKCN